MGGYMLNKFRPDDFNSRLHDTIVTYDGEPVWLKTDTGSLKLSITPLETETSKLKEARLIDPYDSLLDLASLKLGYFQNRGNAMYACRAPVRKYKQGVSVENIRVYSLSQAGLVPSSDTSLIYTPTFALYAKGFSIDVETAMKKLRYLTSSSIALNRDVALVKRDKLIAVYYKRDEIGFINQEKRVIQVPSFDNAWIVSKYLMELKLEVE